MINAENITYAYKGMEDVLKDISLSEGSGHFIAILGNNGAGKSTFLKCLNHIIQPKSGRVLIDGSSIKKMSRREIAKNLSYVEQNTVQNQLTVYDTVLLGRKPYIQLNPDETDYKITEETLKRFHLEKMSLRYTDELSGGELKKVILARAIAQKPKVLLLDEPTEGLDLKNQHEVMEILSDIAKTDNISVIIVIHDINLALGYCDRFLMLHEGRVFNYGDSSIITEEAINTVYNITASVINYDGRKIIVVE